MDANELVARRARGMELRGMLGQLVAGQVAHSDRSALVKLASGYLEDGIMHEPRAFYDVIAVNPDGTLTRSSGDTFQNGEQFPVRLTHMTAAVGLLNQDEQPVEDDERNISRIGMRMQFHNQNYMNPIELAVPVWANKVVAASDSITFGNAHWMFDAPFVLSARDTLSVDVALTEIPDTPELVTVTFNGIGMQSGRPYALSGQRLISDGVRTTLNTVFFRNDGSEPILVSDMTVNDSRPEDDLDPSGDIRNVNLNIRQAGNGTNAFWVQAPDDVQPFGALMQGTNWGVTTGRAVVHEFPGDGLIWEPAEGISIITRALDTNEFSSSLHIALHGYITVV